jgi:hypothetical protein
MRLRHPLRLLIPLIVLLAGTGLPPEIARAQGADGVTLTAAGGLDGYCKDGHWYPVRVRLENTGGGLDGLVTVESSTGLGAAWSYSAEVSLPSVSHKEITIFVQPVNNSDNFKVALSAEGGLVAAATQELLCLGASDSLHGVWAGNPSLFNVITSVKPAGGLSELAQLEPADFPARFQGLGMLDTIIISDVDTSVLSREQRDALRAWVDLGGVLIVAGGAGWQKTAAGLGGLLPLAPSGEQTIPNLAALSGYARSTDPLDTPTVIATGELHAEAEVIVEQDGLPLVAARPLGFGAVIYLAADPALEPLRAWGGMEQVYSNLLTGIPAPPGWSGGFKDWDAADNALANVPGLALPPFWLVCGFLLIYVVLIGPVNYLVLRALKMREMAWVSIPVITLIFTLIALFVGALLSGRRSIVNHLAIVEVWQGEEQAVVHSLLGIYSPGRTRYDIRMEGGFLASGVPYGAFNAPIAANWSGMQTDDGFEIREFQVDVGGLRGNVVSGVVPAPEFGSTLGITPLDIGSSYQLAGEIRNDSGVTLEEAVLLLPGSAIQLGTFSPGETASISQRIFMFQTANVQDTMSDVFGVSTPTYYYGSGFGAGTDEDLLRKASLFGASMGYNQPTRGEGVYLVGWTDESAAEADLPGRFPKYEYTTLYIIDLTPVTLRRAAEVMPSSLTIPAIPISGTVTLEADDFFAKVTAVSGLNGNFGAYEVQASGSGSFTLYFSPIQPVTYGAVESLRLSLSNYGQTGAVDVRFLLYDFAGNSWREFQGLAWGVNELDQPGRYVGETGEVRVEIRTPTGLGSFTLESIEISLTLSE